MTLGDVLFDTGEADLKNSANRTVLKLVQFLQLNPRVWCVSRATPTAPARRGKPQAVARSCAVGGRHAGGPGIDEKRMQVEGYGDQYPIEANASSGAGRRTVGWKLCSPTKRPARACPLSSSHRGPPCGPSFCRFNRFDSYHTVVLSTMWQLSQYTSKLLRYVSPS
jgi:hypothetical protein